MCNHVISSLIMCLVGGIKWDRLGWGHFFRLMVTTYKTFWDGIIPPWNILRISGNKQNFQIEGMETAYLNHTRSQAKRTCLRTGLIPPASMGEVLLCRCGAQARSRSQGGDLNRMQGHDRKKERGGWLESQWQHLDSFILHWLWWSEDSGWAH